MRFVFGGPIDLDPASTPQANQLVEARVFYTAQDNGLELPWFGNVYCNPPGGSATFQGEKVNQPGLWWAHAAKHHERRSYRQAAFMIFNLETIRHALEWSCRQPLEYPTIFFRERLDYLRPSPDGPVPQGSPTHPSALVYLGPNVARFRKVFGPHGFMHGIQARCKQSQRARARASGG